MTMQVAGLIEALEQKDRTGIEAAPHHPAFVAGYHDAQRGITACPYGVPEWALKWAEGYDFAEDNGEAELPRFGKIAGKKGRK